MYKLSRQIIDVKSLYVFFYFCDVFYVLMCVLLYERLKFCFKVYYHLINNIEKHLCTRETKSGGSLLSLVILGLMITRLN